MTVYLGMLDPVGRGSAFPGGDCIHNTAEWYYKLRSSHFPGVDWSQNHANFVREVQEHMWSFCEEKKRAQMINAVMHSLTLAPDSDKFSSGGADRVLKHYSRLIRFGINPVEMGFSSVKKIVRYLGYGDIYDRPGTCLLTHQPLDGVDAEHIIEAPVWVPMLNTSEVPKVTILRSIVDRRSWDCTHMGCDLPKNPHTDPSRYTQSNRHESTCAITGRLFTDDVPWENANSGEPGFPLIPVHPWVKQEISQILMKMGSPRGLDPTEWMPSKLMPHIPSSRAS